MLLLLIVLDIPIEGERAPKHTKRRNTMLVLSRKINEEIMIGEDITIVVVDIRGGKVRLGFKAPREISIHRQEVFDLIKEEAEEKKRLQQSRLIRQQSIFAN